MYKNFKDVIRNLQAKKVEEVINQNTLLTALKSKKKVLVTMSCLLILFAGLKFSSNSKFEYSPIDSDSFIGMVEEMTYSDDEKDMGVYKMEVLDRFEKSLSKMSTKSNYSISQEENEYGLECFFKDIESMTYTIEELPKNKYNSKALISIDLNIDPSQTKLNKKDLGEICKILKIAGLEDKEATKFVNMLSKKEYINGLKPIVHGAKNNNIFFYNANEQILQLYIK